MVHGAFPSDLNSCLQGQAYTMQTLGYVLLCMMELPQKLERAGLESGQRQLWKF